MWRHGDVLISKIDKLPPYLRKRHGNVLVTGEVTGHSHQLMEMGNFNLFEDDQFIYIDIFKEKATLIHEEHKPIELQKGQYKVWVQREYTPKEIVKIRD